jgi:hypothetical protein
MTIIISPRLSKIVRIGVLADTIRDNIAPA